MLNIIAICYRKSRAIPDDRYHNDISPMLMTHQHRIVPFPEQYQHRTDVDGYVFSTSCKTENITTSLEISFLHDFSPHVEAAARRRFLDLRHIVDYCVWSPAVTTQGNDHGDLWYM